MANNVKYIYQLVKKECIFLLYEVVGLFGCGSGDQKVLFKCHLFAWVNLFFFLVSVFKNIANYKERCITLCNTKFTNSVSALVLENRGQMITNCISHYLLLAFSVFFVRKSNLTYLFPLASWARNEWFWYEIHQNRTSDSRVIINVTRHSIKWTFF